MTTDLAELTTDAEWDDAVQILGQLWTETDDGEVRAWREVDGYRLLGYYVEDELVGVAGLYLQVVLFHERTGWIHDLVVDEDNRSESYGGRLLDAVAEWAEERGCETVGLVSRLTNEDATAFYDESTLERFGYASQYDPSLGSGPLEKYYRSRLVESG